MIATTGILINKYINKTNKKIKPIEDVGIPKDLDNSKMVSEGSQFGIQYYNEMHS